MKPVYGRMPVLLARESYGTWIDRGRDAADVLPLLRRFPADRMEAVTVGPFVNDPRNDGPECLASPA